jgi:predicted phosphodiesterase
MRVFATSDIHVDYDVNARWIRDLSAADYRDDVLILAGDVTDVLTQLEWSLRTLAKKFRKVQFVPGNHDLWVVRHGDERSSLQKFDDVRAAVEASGASMEPFREGAVSIIPLLSWYDYSFGEPSAELRSVWMDYLACRWPAGSTEAQVAAHFAAFNDRHASDAGDLVITYSHFLPRIDVMPGHMPGRVRFLDPILGSSLLDGQVRKLNARMHVYGHSHINRRVEIEGVTYINNAFGYPHEVAIASKRLLCIHEC